MEHIEQIRELFYSNNIELAIQLIKGQGYELREVLKELYHKYVNVVTETSLDYYNDVFELTISIDGRNIEMYKVRGVESMTHRLWLHDNFFTDLTLDQCLDKMTDYLIDKYG